MKSHEDLARGWWRKGDSDLANARTQRRRGMTRISGRTWTRPGKPSGKLAPYAISFCPDCLILSGTVMKECTVDIACKTTSAARE